MPETATKQQDANEVEQELTDGFNLVIDALKLNGIETIYNVPGIPITDLGRMCQASGIRVLSFRHEHNAGYAASIAGLPDQEAGRVSLLVKTLYFKEVKDFGNGLVRPAVIETDSPLYKSYRSIMISAKIKARDFKDEVFTLTFMPNLESLR